MSLAPCCTPAARSMCSCSRGMVASILSSAGARDLIVLSDLHLGRGKTAATGRYYRLEAFFYDDDFAAFCDWLVRDAAERGRELRVVVNGDAFDLLRIDPPRGLPRPSPPELVR